MLKPVKPVCMLAQQQGSKGGETVGGGLGHISQDNLP